MDFRFSAVSKESCSPIPSRRPRRSLGQTFGGHLASHRPVDHTIRNAHMVIWKDDQAENEIWFQTFISGPRDRKNFLSTLDTVVLVYPKLPQKS
eukprot:2884185-Pleurochrysis_carterae.AAC.1